MTNEGIMDRDTQICGYTAEDIALRVRLRRNGSFVCSDEEAANLILLFASGARLEAIVDVNREAVERLTKIMASPDSGPTR